MSNSSSGGSLIGLLTIVFVVLKLTHVIDWSWWWVLSPPWIIVALSVIVTVAAVIAARRDSRTLHGKLSAYERSLRKHG
jgi:hypothetical protein